jgi:AcrR family transcriptional regulator
MNVHSQRISIVRATDVKTRVERAAIDLFAAHGVDGVSIADIAGAAGISQGALYRHYRGKDQLATHLFASAYRRTGAELLAICGAESRFVPRITAMIALFCALYDRDAALFRFMLIAQHDFLPALDDTGADPVFAIETAINDAIAAGEIEPVEIAAAAAAVMGIVLQTALFHIYGRLMGPLAPRAAALARAALAAVAGLTPPTPITAV